MKILISSVLVLFLAVSVAEASWYVVNADNKVIAKCEYQPDQTDLQLRREFAVFSNEDIPLMEAEYINGKIVKCPKDKQSGVANKEKVTDEKEE